MVYPAMSSCVHVVPDPSEVATVRRGRTGGWQPQPRCAAGLAGTGCPSGDRRSGFRGRGFPALCPRTGRRSRRVGRPTMWPSASRPASTPSPRRSSFATGGRRLAPDPGDLHREAAGPPGRPRDLHARRLRSPGPCSESNTRTPATAATRWCCTGPAVPAATPVSGTASRAWLRWASTTASRRPRCTPTAWASTMTVRATPAATPTATPAARSLGSMNDKTSSIKFI